MYKVADQLNSLLLPAKEKKIAGFRAKILRLEGHFFQLLYLEFKNHDETRYRPEINEDTRKINDLRLAWGKYDESN